MSEEDNLNDEQTAKTVGSSYWNHRTVHWNAEASIVTHAEIRTVENVMTFYKEFLSDYRSSREYEYQDENSTPPNGILGELICGIIIIGTIEGKYVSVKSIYSFVGHFCDQATVSRHVTWLQKRKWVDKVKDPEDGRRSIIVANQPLFRFARSTSYGFIKSIQKFNKRQLALTRIRETPPDQIAVIQSHDRTIVLT